MPLESGGAAPTTNLAITLVRDTGTEAEVAWIQRFLATLPGIMRCIEQWLESEPARLRAREEEIAARQQRIASGEPSIEWTDERLQAHAVEREQQRQQWRREHEERLEQLYQERYGDWRPPEPTREQVEQYFQQMAPGEDPCPDVTVVRTLAMSLEELHQHYHEVEAAFRELKAANPDVVPHLDTPLGGTNSAP
jgi:DNA repair exonuclease SbcCD ATPase subunit